MAARLNHSCCPNVGYDFDDDWTVRMYTTRDVQAGEELLDCYSDVVYHPDVAVRRAVLQKRFGFCCTCHVCSEQNSHMESRILCILL